METKNVALHHFSSLLGFRDGPGSNVARRTVTMTQIFGGFPQFIQDCVLHANAGRVPSGFFYSYVSVIPSRFDATKPLRLITVVR